MNEKSADDARNAVRAAGLSWHEEADAETLAESLGHAVVTRLDDALSSHGQASLVVSGGSTPAPVFRFLSRSDINWSQVTITLADERWVPLTSPDSNEKLVRDTLLCDKAATAQFVSLYREGPADSQALRQITTQVSAIPRPFTVVMLGMGADGHTASLFPDAPETELAAAMALETPEVVAFMHPPSVAQTRITLTRACLLNAANRYLHITGDGKRAVLARVLLAVAGQSYEAGQAPVTGLLVEQSERAAVYWSP